VRSHFTNPSPRLLATAAAGVVFRLKLRKMVNI
jgi:hypothetical protein